MRIRNEIQKSLDAEISEFLNNRLEAARLTPVVFRFNIPSELYKDHPAAEKIIVDC